MGPLENQCFPRGMMVKHAQKSTNSREGVVTDAYAQRLHCRKGGSSSASRLRQRGNNFGLTADPVGLQAKDQTIAELLKHRVMRRTDGNEPTGDRNEYLPSDTDFANSTGFSIT